MIILGLLLILGTAGLSLAVVWANDGIVTAPAAAVELFGNQMHVSVGQLFLVGAAAGALTLLGPVMIISGLGRNARRRSTARHQLRDHRQEMKGLENKHDAKTRDLAARHTATVNAADSDGITARR